MISRQHDFQQGAVHWISHFHELTYEVAEVGAVARVPDRLGCGRVSNINVVGTALVVGGRWVALEGNSGCGFGRSLDFGNRGEALVPDVPCEVELRG